jgi:hypothetical protein
MAILFPQFGFLGNKKPARRRVVGVELGSAWRLPVHVEAEPVAASLFVLGFAAPAGDVGAEFDGVTQRSANRSGGTACGCVYVDLEREAVHVWTLVYVVLWRAASDLPDRIRERRTFWRFAKRIQANRVGAEQIRYARICCCDLKDWREHLSTLCGLFLGSLDSAIDCLLVLTHELINHFADVVVGRWPKVRLSAGFLGA